MPSTAGMQILVAGQLPNYHGWLQMIEARRELIKPFLDKFTLSTLGDLECLYGEGSHKWALNKLVGEQTPEIKRNLLVQGIFRAQPFERRWFNPPLTKPPHFTNIPRDGILRIWGLSRAGAWVTARVYHRGEPGYKNRGRDVVTGITLRETNLDTLFLATGESPRNVWTTLGETTKRWAERRKALYEQAFDIQLTMGAEEFALASIEKRDYWKQ